MHYGIHISCHVFLVYLYLLAVIQFSFPPNLLIDLVISKFLIFNHFGRIYILWYNIGFTQPLAWLVSRLSF